VVTEPSTQTRWVVSMLPFDMRLPLRRSNDMDRQIADALNGIAQRLDRLIELAERTTQLPQSRTAGYPAVGEARPGAPRLQRQSESLQSQSESLRSEVGGECKSRVTNGREHRGAPLSSSQVNARISNPHNKHRFQRKDGGIVLAEEA
jgi:hypothetical protein